MQKVNYNTLVFIKFYKNGLQILLDAISTISVTAKVRQSTAPALMHLFTNYPRNVIQMSRNN
jgi:hypothetical protein